VTAKPFACFILLGLLALLSACTATPQEISEQELRRRLGEISTMRYAQLIGKTPERIYAEKWAAGSTSGAKGSREVLFVSRSGASKSFEDYVDERLAAQRALDRK